MRNAIKEAMDNKELTVYSFCKENKIISQTLFNKYLKGEDVVSAKNIEKIFAILGIKITDGEEICEGEFHSAICKAFAKCGQTKYAFCKKTDIHAPSLGNYLKQGKGLETANIGKVCFLLGLYFAVPPTIKKEPSTKKKVPRSSFAIGRALSKIIKEKNTTVYAVGKTLGISNGNLYIFLRTGEALGSEVAQNIFDLLGVHITDGETVYGSNIREAILQTLQKKGISQTSVIKALKMSTMLNLFLNNKSNIGMTKVDKIFKHLGLSIK